MNLCSYLLRPRTVIARAVIGFAVLASVTVMLPGLAAKPAVAAQGSIWDEAQNPRSEFLHTYSATEPPAGFVRFCRTTPQECRRYPYQVQLMPLAPERWEELVTVNELVNKMVRPVSDLELYGELERWVLPASRGDCEDYVLLKRHLLMKRGWPASVLLITVVKDEAGEGHAVLTVRTDRGDVVLDNKINDILLWNSTGYQFFKWQSPRDPMEWFSLLPKTLTELLTATAIDRQLD